MLSVTHADITFNADNTPVSIQFDDVYFSTQGGAEETDYVFLQGNRLWERWQQSEQAHFVIAETGFGTGLNFFSAITLFRRFRQENPQSALKRLFFISFEKYPLTLPQLIHAHQNYAEFAELTRQLHQYWPEPIEGCYRFHFDETTLDLWFGDVNDNLPQLGDYMIDKIDAWFLDGFAPSKNPAMWRDSLYRQMFRFTKPHGTFSTYTAASAVKKGLENAGFHVEKRKGYGKKRECLAGAKTQAISTALSAPWFSLSPAELRAQDIAVIGGGIASLATALALHRRGATVTLYCEDEQPALNASGNEQGAFYPQLSDDDERHIRFNIHAFAYGQQWLRWAEQQRIEFEHEFCGVALCGYNADSRAKLHKIASYQWPASLYRSLNAEELSAKVGLPLSCSGGFIPQGAWLAPRQFVQHAFAHLAAKGMVLKTSQNITALYPSPSSCGWRLENVQGAIFQHEAVVLANGHKLTQFAQTEKLPLYPVRGQVSRIPTGENLLKLKSVLCYDGYLTPVNLRKTTHCLGASHVRNCDNRDFSLTEQQENQLKIQQNIHMPWTKEVDTSANLARQGIRCAVRDRIPMAGNVPNFARQAEDYKNLFNLRRRKQPIPPAAHYPNLYLIGALGSRGLTSAPLLGELLASLIYNEPLPLSEELLHCLNPNRAWVRKWLKGAPVV